MILYSVGPVHSSQLAHYFSHSFLLEFTDDQQRHKNLQVAKQLYMNLHFLNSCDQGRFREYF
jgi:hypothetical protein